MHEHEHPVRTRNNQYRYVFTAKHHGADKSAAQWRKDLSEDDEFAVFDGADQMNLSDMAGNLYGAIPDGDDSLIMLGSLQEQIAKFPCAAAQSSWHGYPIWARTEQKYRPTDEVFEKMVQAGLIQEWMRRRLMKGDHV
jgi:hypothetical protein